MNIKYIDKTFPITLQDLIDLAKSENMDPRDLKLIISSNQADLAAYVQCALLNQDQGNISIELYVSAEDGFDEDISLKQKPKSPKPKSPMKQGKIKQAEEYLKEIKDLVENPEIHITSDFNLDTLSRVKDYIKAFIQKQQ